MEQDLRQILRLLRPWRRCAHRLFRWPLSSSSHQRHLHYQAATQTETFHRFAVADLLQNTAFRCIRPSVAISITIVAFGWFNFISFSRNSRVPKNIKLLGRGLFIGLLCFQAQYQIIGLRFISWAFVLSGPIYILWEKNCVSSFSGFCALGEGEFRVYCCAG